MTIMVNMTNTQVSKRGMIAMMGISGVSASMSGEGNAIVRKIMALGVSQYRIAKELPVSKEQLRKWVRNWATPNDENTEKLRCYYEKACFERNLHPFQK